VWLSVLVDSITEQAQDVHSFIREGIAKQNTNVAKGLTILYGGM